MIGCDKIEKSHRYSHYKGSCFQEACPGPVRRDVQFRFASPSTPTRDPRTASLPLNDLCFDDDQTELVMGADDVASL
jgi:hypothetical protein